MDGAYRPYSMLTQASPCRERWRFGRGDGAASAWLYLFNLRIDDEDLRRLPLVERREHLAELLADAGRLCTSTEMARRSSHTPASSGGTGSTGNPGGSDDASVPSGGLDAAYLT